MRRSAFLLALLLPSLAPAADAPSGAIAGWDRHDGHVLLGELNCAACHKPGEADAVLLSKQAPILAEVGRRVTPQYLRTFLSQPHTAKPGTTMPDLLHGKPQEERDRVVDALVHYLASLGGPIDQRSSGASLVQIERGRDLYHSVGCVACHQPFEPPPAHKKDPATIPFEDDPRAKRPMTPSVPLGDLASKTTVEELTRFLQDPLHVRPSGRMPSLSLEPGEARMIAAYLLRDQFDDKQKAPGVGLDVAIYEGNWQKTPDFAKLTPVFEGEARTIDLQAVLRARGKKRDNNFGVRFHGIIDVPADGSYRFWTRSDDGSILRINDRVVVDNDGHHASQDREGRVQLRKGRHAFEVTFFQAGGPFELAVTWQPPGSDRRGPIPAGVLFHSTAAMIPRGIADFTIDPARAEEGKKQFASLGCASCHDTTRGNKPTDESLRLKAPALLKLDPAKAGGCLSEDVAAGRPRYDLDAQQREAMRKTLAELAGGVPTWDVARRIDHRMKAMNCYACHVRGEKGGPDPTRANYCVYDIVVDLGDEGRLPPPLDGVGAKLTPVGFEDYLMNGAKNRTYMATRMPQFGRANVGGLPDLFAKADLDKVEPRQVAVTGRLIDEGRRLLDKNKLACINCHAWGPHHLPGAEGLDLLQVTRRLRPEWFHRLLVDPQLVKPNTRMPGNFPDGKSFFTDILDGDMHRQIDAVWAYLSAGQKGGMPPGLSPDDSTMLVPSDEPIVFRTFLDRVGAHAILVGFRQRTHVAFDANRVRTALAWTGDFISTRAAWEGRAGQYAKPPSADLVWLPEGPAFTRLKSLIDPWPGDLPKRQLGSNRTPEGWHFRGYRFDEKRNPTFLYEFGEVRVEETPGTDFRPNEAYLVRRFRLSADEGPESLYFRAAVGESIEEKDGVYTVDGKLRFRLQHRDARPIIREAGKTKELLVPIEFSPVGKGAEATLTVEMMW